MLLLFYKLVAVLEFTSPLLEWNVLLVVSSAALLRFVYFVPKKNYKFYSWEMQKKPLKGIEKTKALGGHPATRWNSYSPL